MCILHHKLQLCGANALQFLLQIHRSLPLIAHTFHHTSDGFSACNEGISEVTRRAFIIFSRDGQDVFLRDTRGEERENGVGIGHSLTSFLQLMFTPH